MKRAVCPSGHGELAVAAAEDHVGHRCPTCAGLWLPWDFIESVATQRDFDSGVFVRALLEHGAGRATLRCPAGHGPMRRSRLGDIELDWCDACRGTWFDSGELGRMLEWHPRHAPLVSSGESSGERVVAFVRMEAAIAAIVAFLSS